MLLGTLLRHASVNDVYGSSSRPFATNIKAQFRAPLVRLAKRAAPALDRKNPLAGPSQSRATQKPDLLRPIANTGIDLLMILVSGRRSCTDSAGKFFGSSVVPREIG